MQNVFYSHLNSMDIFANVIIYKNLKIFYFFRLLYNKKVSVNGLDMIAIRRKMLKDKIQLEI
jgi:hypothetical protein